MSELVQKNRRRGRKDFEFELLDTGVFDEDRYFDVFVEYAKADRRRYPDPSHRPQSRAGSGDAAPAADALVPQHLVLAGRHGEALLRAAEANGGTAIEARHEQLGTAPACERDDLPVLFTENETNLATDLRPAKAAALPPRTASTTTSCRAGDGGEPGADGHQGGVHWRSRSRPAGGSAAAPPARRRGRGVPFGAEYDRILDARRAEADEFYRAVTPTSFTEDEAQVIRQALAGMLWSKQSYLYDVRHG